MKTFLAVFLLAAVFAAAQVKNPPVLITRLRPIILKESSERPDHKKFFIQVFSPEGTNWTKFEKADRLLTVKDLKAVPDGLAVLVVQSIFEDGDKSAETAFDIHIQHQRPAAPSIESAVIKESEAEAKTFDDLMFIRRRERAKQYPPPAPAGAIIPVPEPAPPPPLPDSTNRAYRADLRRNE